MPNDLAATIERLLRPTDDATRWLAAVRALPAAKATPLLAAIARDAGRQRGARLQATTMLGLVGGEGAVPAVAAEMTDADPVLRARAAEALGRIATQQPVAINALVNGLNDVDYFVRECSAKALGALKRADAVPVLSAMAASDVVPANRAVAQAAIDAIQGTA